MKNSTIAWTDHTFNPWWGCVKVSEGCKNCYAETFAKRTGNDVWGVDAPRRFFGEKHWSEPRKWNTEAAREGVRRRVFCASMADVFETHRDEKTQDAMDSARNRLAELVKETPHLDWLFLTKRIENAEEDWFLRGLENVWIGATCENQERANERIPHLLRIPAAVHFISVEPQIEKVSLEAASYFMANETTFYGLEWVIVGGESGPKCRPFDPDWARLLRDECVQIGAHFFMKQLGGHPHKRENLEDLPADLRIRRVPGVTA